MAKRSRATTAAKIQRWIDEGRGQGEGKDYKPWLQIQDVPSNGRVSRVRGWKTQREHHLMSQQELRYFYLAEWSLIVTDIREQYPLLPLERTQQIAESLGIEHPKDPSSKEPVVMTTDFLLTVELRKGGSVFWARTIKPISGLNKRQLDKFRIEYQFFREQNIDWGIVTDQDIPTILADNIGCIHDFYDTPNIPLLDLKTVELIALQLFKAIENSSLPLSKIALQQDDVLGFEPGTCLSIVKHMLARQRWVTDMTTRELRNFSTDIQLEQADDNRLTRGNIG